MVQPARVPSLRNSWKVVDICLIPEIIPLDVVPHQGRLTRRSLSSRSQNTSMSLLDLIQLKKKIFSG